MEVVDLAVELVAAALGHDIQRGAGECTVLGRGAEHRYVNLFDSLEVDRAEDRAGSRVGNVDAVGVVSLTGSLDAAEG